MRRTGGTANAVRLDLALYCVSLLFAGATAFVSEFYGYRVWGNFASVGYLLAAAHSGWLLITGPGTGLRSRWLPVAASGLFAVLIPLTVLVIRRAPSFVWGPWPWSFPAQPEVWVVERAARLLIDTGTPYLDLSTLGRLAHPDDYTPYGPSMVLYGMPRALFGDSPVTDSRVWFLLIGALAVWLAWRVLGRPAIPVRAAQLVAISPLTALTFVVAGDDLAVLALIVLTTALAYRSDSPVWTVWTVAAGFVAAVAVTTKLTALPAVAVLLIGILAVRGLRGAMVFAATMLAAGAAIIVPVLIVAPATFVEHVIKFPIGLGQARSPASSPLPGHLIAGLGPAGHTIALILLGIAAALVTGWLVVRPPRTARDACMRIAVGLGAAIMLAPATRWGYLVYPVVLLGAAIAFSKESMENADERRRHRP